MEGIGREGRCVNVKRKRKEKQTGEKLKEGGRKRSSHLFSFGTQTFNGMQCGGSSSRGSSPPLCGRCPGEAPQVTSTLSP